MGTQRPREMWNLLKNMETREVPSFWGTRIHLIRGVGGRLYFYFLPR